MQPESMTLESQDPSVLQILRIKPLLEMLRAVAQQTYKSEVEDQHSVNNIDTNIFKEAFLQTVHML